MNALLLMNCRASREFSFEKLSAREDFHLTRDFSSLHPRGITPLASRGCVEQIEMIVKDGDFEEQQSNFHRKIGREKRVKIFFIAQKLLMRNFSLKVGQYIFMNSACKLNYEKLPEENP
ncbi:hypothetical protein CEXT_519501 [Caerostris extrusa]|uniref:Uncharacterized protein n=1 Tax=Caerostris extrusa TaxID=172846 RepID=A0AAV4T8D9_CAEEX|nr:hypothetical protein CEXT_519501 [Caerostris extrusa]